MLEASMKDPLLAEIFNMSDFCIPESTGMGFIAKIKGFPLQETIPGIDLMLKLCSLAAQKKWSAALIGGAPGIAEAAGRNLRNMCPGLELAGTVHGYHTAAEEARELEKVFALKPKFVFAALGVPRQEKWIYRHKDKLAGAAALGIGGSLDVLSGKISRAPLWMRRAGLEWLYRTLRQPWRIVRVAKTFKAVFLAITTPIS